MKNNDQKILKQINKLSRLLAEKINADPIFIRDKIINAMEGMIKQNKPKTKADNENDEYLKNLIRRK